jgi:TRAP-type C4-dicarboxylate transport system substrate-binding protein
MRQLDAELGGRLKAKGMQFTYPDLTEFKQAVQPAYEALYRQLGPRAPTLAEEIRQTR